MQVLGVGDSEPLQLRLFLAVGAHDADARQRFLGDGADVGQLRLDLLEPLVDGAPEELHRQGHERQRDQREQREPCVDGQHQDEGHHEPEQRVRGIHHRRSDHLAHGVQVVGGAGHQVAGATRLEVGDRHLLELREEVVAHVVLDIARRPDEDAAHEEPEDAAADADAEQGGAVQRQLLAGDPGREVVDRMPQYPGRGERDSGGSYDAGEPEEEVATIGPDVAE